MEFLNTPGHPPPQVYHHSATTTAAGRLIFTSGIVGNKDGQVVQDLKGQVKQAFKNLDATLVASGARPVDVIQLRFYVVNWRWTETEHFIQEWMTLVGHKPACALIPVPKLSQDEILFEVEAVAALGGIQQTFTPRSLLDATKSAPAATSDVIVIGGGFSGVQAAYDMHKSGLNVVLLEATHRIGGRSKTIKLASGPGYTELGATWINRHTQPKVYGHAKRLGLTVLEQYNPPEAQGIFQKVDGTVTRARVADPPYTGPEV